MLVYASVSEEEKADGGPLAAALENGFEQALSGRGRAARYLQCKCIGPCESSFAVLLIAGSSAAWSLFELEIQGLNQSLSLPPRLAGVWC